MSLSKKTFFIFNWVSLNSFGQTPYFILEDTFSRNIQRAKLQNSLGSSGTAIVDSWVILEEINCIYELFQQNFDNLIRTKYSNVLIF